MEGTLSDSHAARVGVSPTDSWNREQNSSREKHEQVSCSGNDGVIQEKSDSSLTADISQAVADDPLHTQSEALELCWYCLKSLSTEELNTHQLEQFCVCDVSQVESEALTLPSSGEHVKYQRDPRPHFGVAHSSRSVSFPLWDTDRSREMKASEDEEENVDLSGSVSCCPHCQLWLPRDTLLWHETKCLLFDGVKNS